jgi:hypothetical protein
MRPSFVKVPRPIAIFSPSEQIWLASILLSSFTRHLVRLEINGMVCVESIQGISTTACPQVKPKTGSSFKDEFELIMADKLMQTTRQYHTWEKIRQKDPAKAQKIARLIMERHSWVEGKALTTPEDRIRFDALTDQLRQHNIHLYNSSQFSDPIFQPEPAEVEQKSVHQASHRASKASYETSQASELNQRHANKNCFEFLAGVLEENGIAYYGKNGIGCHLIEKARHQDLSPNAFLTGEAVTGLLCSEPVSIHLPRIDGQSFDLLWKKLEPHLQEGAILSYSSQYFGHTGIVGRSGDQWEYINSSGLFGNQASYRIKEEDLKTEIHGWLERARKNHTFLSVTIGGIDPERAALFSKTGVSDPKNTVNFLA